MYCLRVQGSISDLRGVCVWEFRTARNRSVGGWYVWYAEIDGEGEQWPNSDHEEERLAGNEHRRQKLRRVGDKRSE
jgi:hypothetical protein